MVRTQKMGFLLVYIKCHTFNHTRVEVFTSYHSIHKTFVDKAVVGSTDRTPEANRYN